MGELLQVDAVDQFHADEIKPARLAQMVGLDDVGMDQVRHQFGLADEILDELFLVGVILADDLHGHALDEIARAVLLGFVNDAHAALENLAHDFVAELVLYGKQRCHAPILKHCRGKSSPGWPMLADVQRIMREIFSPGRYFLLARRCLSVRIVQKIAPNLITYQGPELGTHKMLAPYLTQKSTDFSGLIDDMVNLAYEFDVFEFN